MNIIEKLDMPIYKKENKFKKIDKDKNFNQKNLYIGENDKNELYFLILVFLIFKVKQIQRSEIMNLCVIDINSSSDLS